MIKSKPTKVLERGRLITGMKTLLEDFNSRCEQAEEKSMRVKTGQFQIIQSENKKSVNKS